MHAPVCTHSHTASKNGKYSVWDEKFTGLVNDILNTAEKNIRKQEEAPTETTAVVHLHKGILLSHKKEEKFTLCNSMDRPGEHYPQWTKPVRERQLPYDFRIMYESRNKTAKFQNNGNKANTLLNAKERNKPYTKKKVSKWLQTLQP